MRHRVWGYTTTARVSKASVGNSIRITTARMGCVSQPQTSIWIAKTLIRKVSPMPTTDSMWLIPGMQRSMLTRVLVSAMRQQTSPWMAATLVRKISSMPITDSMCLIGEVCLTGEMKRCMCTRVLVSAMRQQTSIWIATTVLRRVSPMPTTDSMCLIF